MFTQKPIVNFLATISIMFLAGVIFADQTHDEALLDAAEKGDLAAMSAALDNGADINVKGGYWQDSALIKAAKAGHIEMVKVLVSKGASLNNQDKNGITALMRATVEGHTQIVQILIEAGADINTKDKFGTAALQDAAGNGHIDIVKMLLSKGAQVNAEDSYGQTAWVLAAERGYVEITQLLKEAGAIEKYDALEWSGQDRDEKNFREVIITNNFAWKKYGQATPDIDFNKYVVVGVFLGVRMTGGYGVEFGKPYLKDNKMVIPYKEHRPGPQEYVTQALTQPYALKVFERKAKVVILHKNEN